MAILCQDWKIPGGMGPFFLLPLAGLVAALCAIPLGLLALRLRRFAFIVMTIAIFYIGQYLAYNLGGLTNGATGLFLPNPPWDAYTFDLPFYYIAFVLLILVTLTSWWVRYSKYGLGLLAIRDDEDRALSLGVQTGLYKFGAYVLSSFFTGMVGAVLAYYSGTVYPYSAFNTNFNISVTVITFIGGIGTLTGPIIGGLLLVPLQQYLNTQFGAGGNNFGLVVFGTILLLTIMVLPGGIVPSLSKYGKQWLVAMNIHQLKKVIPHSIMNNDVVIAEIPHNSVMPVIQVEPPFHGVSSGFSSEIPHMSKSRVTTLETSHESVSSIVPNEIYMQNEVMNHSAKHAALNIPRRLTERPLSETVVMDSTKFKPKRLISIAQQDSSTQVQVKASTSKGWRCPYCHRPFLLKGDSCYCPKCGFTRSLNG